LDRCAPKTGDIAIRPEADASGKQYAVCELSGVVQVSYSSFAMALDVATRYARSAGLDVCYEENGIHAH